LKVCGAEASFFRNLFSSQYNNPSWQTVALLLTLQKLSLCRYFSQFFSPSYNLIDKENLGNFSPFALKYFKKFLSHSKRFEIPHFLVDIHLETPKFFI
jgi:hypothetical protein